MTNFSEFESRCDKPTAAESASILFDDVYNSVVSCQRFAREVTARGSEDVRPADIGPEDGRPGDGGKWPGLDRSSFDYEQLAAEIERTGKLPRALRDALQDGLSDGGKLLELDKLNKELEKIGSKMRVEINSTMIRIEGKPINVANIEVRAGDKVLDSMIVQDKRKRR